MANGETGSVLDRQGDEVGASGASAPFDADVIVVGYGPVGQSLAALLAVRGHRVIVCERREARYETPRAGHFDHEIMRIFQSIGVADEVRRIAAPARLYEFLDPDGTVVSRLPRDWDAPSGWDASYHFYQPELEDVLDAAVLRLAGVEVRLSTPVVAVQQHTEHAAVTLANGSVLTARYVVGADGANSLVRAQSGVETTDLGFRGDWLVVDLQPQPGAAPLDIPDTGQVLDAARPNHMGRVDHRYYRFEFMLVDGDDPQQVIEPSHVWALLARWTGPHQVRLIRQTVYQFRSVLADSFGDGSILLAGDAAHLMPPFLGQGMSTGIRDAATLSWMLDLVLSGAADPELLHLYTATRRPQVLAYIEESVRVGSIVCETDAVRAAQRRRELQSAATLPPPFQPPTGAAFLAGTPLAGQLAVQPLLRTDEGKVERSDDLAGRGFTLISSVVLDAAADEIDALGRTIGLRTVVIGPGGMAEEGQKTEAWLRDAGVVAVLVRPDFYVFGSASDAGEVPALLASLRRALYLI